MQEWNNKEEFRIILNEQTPRVDHINDSMQEWITSNRLLLKQFLFFSSTIPTALGVAANQVSWKGSRIMSRFFSHRIGERGPYDPFEIAINPIIVKKYGSPITEFEGCLCWPGKTIKAQRWLKMDVEYYDLSGKKFFRSLDRQESQIWQHEMDHLDGVEEDVILGPIKVENKADRNSPCPCGSLIKYKKCCGK